MSVLRAACLAFSLLAFASAVPAQPYPAKPVRLVVPYPPGGSNDVLSRITAQAMTPNDIINRLATELTKALQSPDLKQRFATEGAEPSVMSREQFTQFVANEITRWRKVALEANIKPE